MEIVGATVEDDPDLKLTKITLPTALLETATPHATPNTLVLRGNFGQANFGGTCNFANVTAGAVVSCVDLDASGEVECDSLTAAAGIACAGLTATVNVTAPALIATTSITSPAATITSCTVTSLTAGTVSASTSVTTPFHTSAAAGAWRSADKSTAAATSGFASYGSGVSSAGSSGDTLFSSGNANNTTGNVLLKSGDSAAGASGALLLQTGEAAGNADAGNILIEGGPALGTGRGASVALVGGTSADAGQVGGDVSLEPGVGGDGPGGVGLGSSAPSFGGAKGAYFIANSTEAANSNPTGGAVMYLIGSAAFWRGTEGGLSVLAPVNKKVNTSDATGTEVLRYELPEECSGNLVLTLVGRREDSVTRVVEMHIPVKVDAGVASFVGTPTTILDEMEAGSGTWIYEVNMDNSADHRDFIVTVNGALATNITWRAFLSFNLHF